MKLSKSRKRKRKQAKPEKFVRFQYCSYWMCLEFFTNIDDEMRYFERPAPNEDTLYPALFFDHTFSKN